jgi:2,2-dialkylglycine decarboxylase (pyruvate)
MSDAKTSWSDVARREMDLLDAAGEFGFGGRIDKRMATGSIFASARGSIITDLRGRDHLDLNSGSACAAFGHTHPHITAAIRQACESILHSGCGYFTIKEIELMVRLAALFPYPLRKSLLGESGPDANELAMAIARVYTGGNAVLRPHVPRHDPATRPVAFAGRRRGHDPLTADTMIAPYCYRCPLAQTFPACGFACLTTSFELIDARTAEQPAAVITEPLFSAGGVIDPPPGWLGRLRALCDERGMLLILDEEHTGLGRLGALFGFAREDVVPDLVTLAEHFGGGVGIGSVTTSARIEEKVCAAGFAADRSHHNDPFLCAAAVASIDVVLADDIPAVARRLGDHLRARLSALMERYELIGDVRGTGLLAGIELVRDRDTKEPAAEAGLGIERLCRQDGLIVSTRRGGCVLRFAPPATTTISQLDQAMEILGRALERVSAVHHRSPGPRSSRRG